MTDSSNYGYLLPHGTDVEQLVTLLGGEDACAAGHPVPFTLRFYDSFDWRLHAAGLSLLQLSSPQGSVLRLKSVDDGEVLESVEFSDTPAWPADLPPGPLRESIAGLLEMRVLLPLADVNAQTTELRALNDDQKTVVRLQLLEMTSGSPRVDEPRGLLPRLRLMPVKGYEKALRELTRQFVEELDWPLAPACLLEEAVTAVGRATGDYTSKLDVPLKREQMAIDALRKILLTLLDTIERNVEGTRTNLDSEFLHDLRVATRRTRSALSQVKRVLPDTVVEEFKQRFAWLGQITGPTRDLDVFLLELPLYRASLPAAMRSDLDMLQQSLEGKHVDAQRQLAEDLTSEQFLSLLNDWRAMLEADIPPGEPGWFADLPVERVVSQRIWGMYKKVLKAGRAAAVHGEPEAMHELRKDCKKLRYLIEFFRNLYEPGELKGIIKALKALLDVLGEFQDKEVQAIHLRELAAEFDLSDPQVLPGVMAIGALAADSLRAQDAAHARFADSFADFDSAENREHYKSLFKHRGQSAQ